MSTKRVWNHHVATPKHRISCHICSCHAVPDSVLFIAPVWPEVSSSAAGVRTKALCDHFLGAGWRVSFLSVAEKNPHEVALAASGVATFSVKVLSQDPNGTSMHEGESKSTGFIVAE